MAISRVKGIVLEYEQTCIAAPTQYECKLADGQIAYIRYRGFVLTLGIGDTLDQAISGHRSMMVAHGCDTMSFMTFEEIVQYTSTHLEWEGAREILSTQTLLGGAK